MLLFDSNIFVYARAAHPHSEACRQVLDRAPGRSDWAVPSLVLLEITHYYRDNGEYARHILGALSGVDIAAQDVAWALRHCTRHADFNDHVLLAGAVRLGAAGIVSLDHFFEQQTLVRGCPRVLPDELLSALLGNPALPANRGGPPAGDR